MELNKPYKVSGFLCIILKFGKMRKAQEFTLYPYDGKGKAVIQSATYIAEIDISGQTQNAVYNSAAGGAYFVHLQMHNRTEVADFPLEIIQALRLCYAGSDGTLKLGGGSVLAVQDLSSFLN